MAYKYDRRTAALKIVKVIGTLAWNSPHETVTDNPINFLVKAVEAGAKTPSLMLYSDEETYVAGLDFKGVSPSNERRRGGWYWPLDTLTGDLNVRLPRYPDFYSAFVVSLKAHGDKAYVGIRERGMGGSNSYAGIELRDSFDDSDYVPQGTSLKWWRGLLSKAKPTSRPVEHKGSDDPMH